LQDGFLKKKALKRICFSAVYNENTNSNLLDIFKMIRSVSDVPITACCIPDSKDTIQAIKEAGADRVVINFETCTQELFEKHRGKLRENSPYTWEKVNYMVDSALEIFGENNVGSHLIIGLDETQEEALKFIQNLYDRKISVSLFAFKPVPNTDMENHPGVTYKHYHEVQLARYLIMQHKSSFDKMKFDSEGRIVHYGISRDELLQVISSGKPFRNMGGCPYCNRINYDNDAQERYYNYPRELRKEEIDIILSEIFVI
jgi:biotin synthase-related radical SAM superfamily protein